MKNADWNGYPKKLIAHCFNLKSKKPLGVDFHLKASSHKQAVEITEKILKQHHPDFLRRAASLGGYQIHFDRIVG